MCGACVNGGHVTLQPDNDPSGVQGRNSPRTRPVTYPHFILPVRARKPLPCHYPSPWNLNASWGSAVAIETTVKTKIRSLTPKVIHKITQLSYLNCVCRKVSTDTEEL